MRSLGLVRLFLVCAIAALADAASAHPPYETEARVITDASGRQLHVFRSYVDGIVGTDPVKLVVRDADNRTIAETDYARSVAIVCWRAPACLVFQYESFTSVVPEQIWRFEGGRLLAATHSRGLLALGIFAPLWDDPYSYLLAFLTLSVPVLIAWSIVRAYWSRQTGVRSLLFGVTALIAPLYVWLWFVSTASQSSLSLHLVALVCVGGVGMLMLARWMRYSRHHHGTHRPRAVARHSSGLSLHL